MNPEEVIAVLDGNNQAATAPKTGARDVVVENVLNLFNRHGEPVIYVQYGYTHKGLTHHWGMNYKKGDTKLNRIFPNGKITTDDIGKTLKVEIAYCDSNNGCYPSVVDLDD